MRCARRWAPCAPWPGGAEPLPVLDRQGRQFQPSAIIVDPRVVDADIGDEMARQAPLRRVQPLHERAAAFGEVGAVYQQAHDMPAPFEQGAGPGEAGGAKDRGRLARPLDQLRQQSRQGIALAISYSFVSDDVRPSKSMIRACHWPRLLR